MNLDLNHHFYPKIFGELMGSHEYRTTECILSARFLGPGFYGRNVAIAGSGFAGRRVAAVPLAIGAYLELPPSPDYPITTRNLTFIH